MQKGKKKNKKRSKKEGKWRSARREPGSEPFPSTFIKGMCSSWRCCFQLLPSTTGLAAPPTTSKAEAIRDLAIFLSYFLHFHTLISETGQLWLGENSGTCLTVKWPPCCSWASITPCLSECLMQDPICSTLFLLSCVCTDWSHLHMQIKCQYETFNILSTSFSAAATWVNISLHALVCRRGGLELSQQMLISSTAFKS